MNVCEWAEQNWCLETGELIRLRPWQRETLLAMFPADGSPSPFETFFISLCKKVGKTELNALATTYAALTFPAPETLFSVSRTSLSRRRSACSIGSQGHSGLWGLVSRAR